MILPVIVATLCAIGALGHRVAGLRRPARPGADRRRSFGWAMVLAGLALGLIARPVRDRAALSIALSLLGALLLVAADVGWGVQGWRERRPTNFGEERHDRGREVPVGPH